MSNRGWALLVAPLLLLAAAPACKRPSEAIHEAAAEGDAEKVQQILAKKPELVEHPAAPLDRTPLHDAKTRRVAEVLVAAGARIDATDRWGRKPIHTATTAEVIDYLVERGCPANAVWGPKNNTVLHSAASAEAVAAFLRHGVPVDVKNHAGETALFVNDVPEAIAALVDGGADPNARDFEGRRPITHATPVRIRALVKAGADVNARDGVGATALHQAAFRGATESVATLIELGADVNARLPPDAVLMDMHNLAAGQNLGNMTPLALANNEKIADLLVKAGGTK